LLLVLGARGRSPNGRYENQENDKNRSQQQHYSGYIALPRRLHGSLLFGCHCRSPPLNESVEYPFGCKERLTLARQAVDRARQRPRGGPGVQDPI